MHVLRGPPASPGGQHRWVTIAQHQDTGPLPLSSGPGPPPWCSSGAWGPAHGRCCPPQQPPPLRWTRAGLQLAQAARAIMRGWLQPSRVPAIVMPDSRQIEFSGVACILQWSRLCQQPCMTGGSGQHAACPHLLRTWQAPACPGSVKAGPGTLPAGPAPAIAAQPPPAWQRHHCVRLPRRRWVPQQAAVRCGWGREPGPAAVSAAAGRLGQ
jgi:hypothetical protein